MLTKNSFFLCKRKDTFSFSQLTLLFSLFWVCRVFPAWCNVDCSQLMSWFDRSQLQLGYLLEERHPARNLPHHSVRHSTFSILHTSFFALLLRFYLSWNNQAQYAKDDVYFPPSSILKWLHKNSPILISFSFFKCMLIGQLSQYSLTKLFRMMLKTTKRC